MKVGVVMPGEGGSATWPSVRDLARLAEAVGLDSIWVYDHLLFRFPDEPEEGPHEAWTMLAALAAATERVELGTLVMCTAFRNPALQAKMAAALDEISGGRLILGLGAGWHEPEFRAFGYPFDHRVGRFEEALTIIRALLRDGRVDFKGHFHEAEECVLMPRPSRRIPLLVAAKGPRMLRLTAEHADAWNGAWYGSPNERLAGRRAELEAACRAVGRDPATLEITVGIEVRYDDLLPPPPEGETPAEALRGSPAEIAAGLRAHADLGAGHAIVSLAPPTLEALERLGAAVARYREFRAPGTR